MKNQFPSTKQILNLSMINNFTILVSVFILSIFISPYYINGDQYHYRKVYEGLVDLSLMDGFVFYTMNLDSKEVVHFFLSWIFSNLNIDKDIFIAFSNALLAYGIVMLLRKWKVSIFIIALLVLTNFYFYVLYFAAERLKYGFIFLIFSLLYSRYIYLFATLSIFSHIQMSVIYLSILFDNVMKHISNAVFYQKINKNFLFIFLISIVTIYILSFYLGSHFSSKFEHYNKEHGVFEIAKIFIFFILSLWYSKNKKEVTMIFFPLFIAVFLIGGERVNMIGYFVFLYYALPINKGFNFGVLLTSAYFLAASFGFAINIIEHGDGFYGN